ncbi:hypothetical protein [Campylobacter sp.]|uniref:hypothetical protein n=1 Tax=Campylobacter sp. TaxID=205 RepID=UPI002A8F08A9|nr:hypothetical protein [Campylobacter sp.]MCI7236916.1 hypothetical protein [Campylobacter sp.]MDY3672716.1 hypothetical protein [Campylobacter sp.]
MSKKDAVNKDIDLAAKLLYFFLISFFGLCAFAFINADKLSLIQFVVLSVAGRWRVCVSLSALRSI